MTFVKNKLKNSWFWDYLIMIVRFWGIFNAVVMCGLGVDVLSRQRLTGFCIILSSLVVFFFEMTWALSRFLKICVRDEASKVFVVWNTVLNVEHWRKSLAYLSLSAALLLASRGSWLSFVSGAMLVLLALLHFFLYFKPRRYENRLETRLLPLGDERSEDDIFEVLDNRLRPKEEPAIDDLGGNVMEI